MHLALYYQSSGLLWVAKRDLIAVLCRRDPPCADICITTLHSGRSIDVSPILEISNTSDVLLNLKVLMQRNRSSCEDEP